MRRNPLSVRTAFAALLLIVSVGCTERGDRSTDGGSPTSYPKGTGEFVETAASARFSERIAEATSDPRLIAWIGAPVPIGLPPSAIAEALSAHLLDFNDTRKGVAQWCLAEGLLSEDQLVRKRFPDDVFYPCAASYLSQLGGDANALPLFTEAHITLEKVVAAVGPLTVARGREWDTYGMNDTRPVFIFTPDGIMQPYFNLPWDQQLSAVIEAASTSIWKQIEDERMQAEGAALDIGLYGTTDTVVGALTAVGGGYELPTETGLLSAHCCDYPYTVRLIYVFDATGSPIDVRFDGFCWAEGWIVSNPTGDLAIDLPPRYDLPGCTLRIA